MVFAFPIQRRFKRCFFEQTSLCELCASAVNLSLNHPDQSPVNHWLAAANNPAIRADLESVYAEVARAIAERAPACWASGRCCNFKEAGHRLYVTGLEAAYTVSRSPHTTGARQLTAESLAEALARGGCPFRWAAASTSATAAPSSGSRI